MNCTEFRQAINQVPKQSAPQGDCAEHLSECQLCQHYYSDLMLEQELNEFQVPEPSPDFLERALARAVTEPVPVKHSSWRWPSAMAASVLAAVVGLFVLWDLPPEEEVVSVAEVVPQQPLYTREQVRIVIYSKEDRDSAELSIELAENLELEGYAGRSQVAWNTKLSKGANLLTLPVLVRNEGGLVQVRSRFGDTSHEVSVQVARRDDSVQLEIGKKGEDRVG